MNKQFSNFSIGLVVFLAGTAFLIGCDKNEPSVEGDINNFLVSPLTRREACERLHYWFSNFFSPEVEAELEAIEPDWVDKGFSECPTIIPEPKGTFIQIVFKGNPDKLRLDFIITMSIIEDRPNTIWILLDHLAGESDPVDKFNHNLEIVAYHLVTGIARTELLQK